MSEPIPIRINCPECGDLHIDEGVFLPELWGSVASRACKHGWRALLAGI